MNLFFVDTSKSISSTERYSKRNSKRVSKLFSRSKSMFNLAGWPFVVTAYFTWLQKEFI